MKRLDATPWAEARLGSYGMTATRTRVPAGYSLKLSGRTARGPWRVLLLRGWTVLFDHERPDLLAGINEALGAIDPTDLENDLAASLRAIGQ